MFSFDDRGWLSLADIPGRQTDLAPPAHNARPVIGRPWPNWTGVTWTADAIYSEPPAPDTRPAQRSAILAQLAAIDAQTAKPRTLREMQLGNTATVAWLQARDDEAADLRAQLAAL